MLKFLKNLKVRSKLMLMVILIGTVAVYGLVYFTNANLENNQRTKELVIANKVTDYILKSSGVQAKERGFTAASMSNPFDRETFSKINTLRVEGDLFLDSALLICKELEKYEFVSKAKANLILKVKERNAQRQKIDVNLGSITYTQDEIKNWIKIQTDLIMAENSFSLSIFNSNVNSEKVIGMNVQLKAAVLNASEFAGRERANIASIIGANSKIDNQMLTKLMKYRGVVEDNIRIIKEFRNDPSLSDSVKIAIDQLDVEFLGRFETYRTRIYDAGINTGDFDINSSEWIVESTRGINSILEISNAVSKDAIKIAASEEKRSKINIGLAIFTTVSLIFIITLSLWISNLISKPIVLLEKAANQIANGNNDVVLQKRSDDDLGRLTDAFSEMAKNIKTGIENLEIERKKEEAFASQAQNAKQIAEENSIYLSESVAEILSAMKKFENGDLTSILIAKRNDEIANLFAGFNNVCNKVKNLTQEVNLLTHHASEGNLSYRANSQNFEGEFRKIISGINHTIEKLVEPINTTSDYLENFSQGIIPNPISKVYLGDFNKIKENINTVINTLNNYVNGLNQFSELQLVGEYNAIIDSTQFDGCFKDIADSTNKVVQGQVKVMIDILETISAYADGDFEKKLAKLPGKLVIANTKMDQVQANILNVLESIYEEIKHIQNGNLSNRADVKNFKGKYLELIQSFNQGLDEIIKPLNLAAEYIERVSKGDIPEIITQEYYGDFNKIKNNLNSLIDTVNSIVNDISKLSKEASVGKLRYRANSDIHQGKFKEIIEEVNHAYSSIVSFLDNLPIPIMAIDRDFSILYINEAGSKLDNRSKLDLENTNCAEHFKTDDCNSENCALHQTMTNKISSKSHTFARPGSNEMEIEYSGIPIFDESGEVIGAFEVVMDQTAIKKAARISEKINEFQTLEAQKLTKVLNELANGNLDVNIKTNAGNADVWESKLTFDNIYSALNNTVIAIKKLAEDVDYITDHSLNGELNTRIDISHHSGNFRTIAESFNSTLETIIVPISEAGRVISQIAKGDLNTSMNGSYYGEFDKLKNDINTLVTSLNQTIGQVVFSAEQTSITARELLTNAETIASASQQQSSQADDVAAAVEEMSQTINENATNAMNTASVATNNGKIAEEGGIIVNQTIVKMQDIAREVGISAVNIEKLGKSSMEIGEIISVIEDIANQTNLLALNAAIEAARAGEQGRGFAVVADEVRKLAERTSHATKEISKMIKGIQNDTEKAVLAMQNGSNEVEKGITLADKAGLSLKQIVESSQQLLDMINQIASASEQQSATAEEISANVTSISKVSAQNSEQIEMVAHAADDLTHQTEELNSLSQKFNIKKDALETRNFSNFKPTIYLD